MADLTLKALGPGVRALPWEPELLCFSPNEHLVALHARCDGWLRVWHLGETRELLRWRARKPPSDLAWIDAESLAVLQQGPAATLEVRAVPDGGLVGAWGGSPRQTFLALDSAPACGRLLLSSFRPTMTSQVPSTALLFEGPELTPRPMLEGINSPSEGPTRFPPDCMLRRCWLRPDGDEVALELLLSARTPDAWGPSLLFWNPSTGARRELPLEREVPVQQLFWLGPRRVLLHTELRLEAHIPGEPAPAWSLEALDRADLEVDPSQERALLVDPTHRQTTWKVGLTAGTARKATLEGRRLGFAAWCHGEDTLSTLGHEPGTLVLARWDAARDRYAIAHRIPCGAAGRHRPRRSPRGRYLLCPARAGAILVDSAALPEGRVDVLY